MRSPSSCCVVTMAPISAAIAEPARPVTSSEVSTGPSSRTRLSPTNVPSADSAPKTGQRGVALQADHHPDRFARDAHDQQREHPDVEELVDHAPQAKGGRHEGRGERGAEAPDAPECREPAQAGAAHGLHGVAGHAGRAPRICSVGGGMAASRNAVTRRSWLVRNCSRPPHSAPPSTRKATWSAMRHGRGDVVTGQDRGDPYAFVQLDQQLLR